MEKKYTFSFLILVQILLVVGVVSDGYCDSNTVQVSGNAKIQLKPDIATINVRLEEKGKTTSDALDALNRKIKLVIGCIRRSNIDEDDYFTQNLNLRPDYTFQNRQSILIGQIASQSISVTLRGFDSSGFTIGQFIDSVSSIDGIQINGVSFDREDKNEANKWARKAAFDNAYKKAQQYANLSERRLGQIFSITDVTSGFNFPVFKSVSNAIQGDFVPKTVPTSNIEVSASLEASWRLR